MNMPGAEDDAGERPLETKENGNVNTDEKELGQDLSDKVSSQEDAAQDENEAAELDPVSSDKVSGEEEMTHTSTGEWIEKNTGTLRFCLQSVLVVHGLNSVHVQRRRRKGSGRGATGAWGGYAAGARANFR